MKKLFIPALLILIWLPVSLAAQSEPAAILEYFEDPYGDMVVTDDLGTPLDYFDMGEELPPGFSISTGGGFAEIRLYPNGTILKLAEDTDFSITNIQGRKGSPSNEFSLFAGKLRTIAARTSGSDYYNVRTPTAVMGVRGTDFLNEVGPEASNLTVREGLVEVIPFDGEPVMAGANQMVDTLADQLQASDLPPDQVNRMFQDMAFRALDPANVPGHSPLPRSEEEVAVSEETADEPEEETETSNVNVEPAPTISNEEVAAAREADGSGGSDSSAPSSQSRFAEILSDIFGMEIGTTTIDGDTYSKVIVQPTLELGKLRLGLYLPLIYTDNMFDPTQWYQPQGNHEWSFGTDQNGDIPLVLLDILKDTMLKIKFIEIGAQGWDPFYLGVGNLDDMSIGHGAIMKNYSNNIDFPAVRKVGLNMGFDLGVFGMELVGDNLADPSIVGGRLFINPFKGFESFQIGLSGIADLFPARDVEIPENYGDPWLLGFGLDIEFFKVNNENFRLMMFGDVSSMMPVFRTDTLLNGIIVESGVQTGVWLGDEGTFKNYGVVAGFRGNIFSFTWALEYRLSTGIYKPTLFNAVYDRNKIEYLTEIITYLDQVESGSDEAQGTVMGIYGEGGFSLADKFSVMMGYFWPWEIIDGSLSFASDDNFILSFNVMEDLIPNIPVYGSISYERTKLIETFRNPENLSLFDANTVVSGEIVYSIAPPLDIVLAASTAVVTDAAGNTVFMDDGITPEIAPVINIETRIHF